MERKADNFFIPIIVISAILSVSIFMTYIEMDFGSAFRSYGISAYGFPRVSVSGWNLIQDLFSGLDSTPFSSMRGVFSCFIVVILVPWVLGVIMLIVSLRRKSTVFSIVVVFSIIGLLISIGGTIGILPEVYNNSISSSFGIQLSLTNEIRQTLFQNLGLAWWICAIGFVLLIILAHYGEKKYDDVIASDIADSEPVMLGEAEDSSRDTQAAISATTMLEGHGIFIHFGEFKNQAIPIAVGESLSIGRSAKQCHIIIQDPIVSRFHCEVKLLDKEGHFSIIDHSSTGTYLNMEKIENEAVGKIGDILSLGRIENRLELI